MGRAAKARIVGLERPLHHVEQALCHLPILDQAGRCFVRGHLDPRVVVGGADNEIRFGHDAPFIGPVMMRESAARRFDKAGPLGRNPSRL